MNNESIKRAALYIRVSSEEQAIHGLSLDAQREALLSCAKKNHYKVVDMYADEGVTARKRFRTRPAFVRMIGDVKDGLIDIILFIRLDRWFRNVADYYEIQRVLDEHHVEWIATEEKYDTTTANGRLNLNIRLAIAQDESDRTSERIKFVFKDKVARGEVVSGNAPFGYRIEGKKLVPDAAEAELARDMFQYYADCRSLRQTRRHMIDEHGKVFAPSGVKVILRNERYIGRAYGEDGFCEPIVDRSLFDRVQELLLQRGQRGAGVGRIYLFTGLIFCAECGGSMAAHTIRDKYVYYRCSKYARTRECTYQKQTNELYLEDWLLKNLGAQFDRYNAQTAAAQAARPAPADTEKLRAKMTKLKDLYLNDLIDREEYAADYAALKEQLAVRTAPRPQIVPIDTAWLKDVEKSYAGLDRAHKKAFWSRVVGRIEIGARDAITVTPARCLLKLK